MSSSEPATVVAKAIPEVVDVLIIAIIDAELRALFQALGLSTYRGPEGDCLGAVVDKPGGRSLFVVCEQATGQGCQVAHGLAARKIRAYKPRHLLVVGIAGGIVGLLDGMATLGVLYLAGVLRNQTPWLVLVPLVLGVAALAGGAIGTLGGVVARKRAREPAQAGA